MATLSYVQSCIFPTPRFVAKILNVAYEEFAEARLLRLIMPQGTQTAADYARAAGNTEAEALLTRQQYPGDPVDAWDVRGTLRRKTWRFFAALLDKAIQSTY